jgi:hypothetical protein|tara:strand:+ start:2897 stop:4090 length:1194 start_codon:yes stop_codon:yes gene_type:complete
MIKYLLSREQLIIYCLAFFFTFFLMQLNFLNSSANFLYLAPPLFLIFTSKKIQIPHIDFQIAFIIYTAIFVIAALLQPMFWPDIFRKLVSFIIFMTAFLYTFINISDRMIAAFKIAIVFYISYLSFTNLLEYSAFGLAELGSAAKNQVGNQRYGFLYILGFWITFFYQSHFKLFTALKFPLLILIGVGILLTFSRASIVGWLASTACFLFIVFGANFRITFKGLLLSIFSVFMIILALMYTDAYLYIEYPVEYFLDSLFSLRSKDGSATFDIANPESSEGFRIFLMKTILIFIGSWPLTGSGFMGIWILFEDRVGSAHGQFNDVLFRTGIIGMAIYLYLLQRLGSFLRKRDMGLFLGLIGILFYGLFHETFKLAHGAFVLAFLFGMYATHKRNNSQL